MRSRLHPSLLEESDPLASVVVATRNRPQVVRACVEALAAQTMEPGTFEVIVVDDGGEPSLMLDMASWTATFPITLMRQENAGPGAARNRGCKQARGEIVTFTDDDCLPTQTWLEQRLTACQTRCSRKQAS